MALQDLTGNYRGKKFEGGVGGGASPVTYGGPEPLDGENVSAETMQASVMGIYEKYGRNAKAMRMAKASPEYAALQGAGISVFGTPTSRIERDSGTTDANGDFVPGKERVVGSTNLENSSPEKKAKAAAQYAALSGTGGRGRTSRTGSSAITDAVNGGAEVTPPAPTQNKPRVPESTAQTAQSTSMDSVNPTPAPEAPKVEPERTTPTQETTKGPRLDTYRGPTPKEATGNAGTFKGGQDARAAEDASRAEAMSPQAKMQRSNDYRKQQGMDEVDFAGREPKYDQDGINDANGRRDNAVNAMSRTRDAGERMDLAKEVNRAQDDREKIKKGFNDESQRLGAEEAKNTTLYGNPYGPDGGKSRRMSERPPELAPLGGYDEKVVSGARGGTISYDTFPRGSDGDIIVANGGGYRPAETETFAVGPMTNKPASSQAEYDKRTKAFDDAGVKQKEENKAAMYKKYNANEAKNLAQLNKKYAGPGPFPRKA